MNDLHKVFLNELCTMYDAEQQLVKALPDAAAAVHSEALREGIKQHFEQTKTHVQRLEEVFRSIGEEPHRKKCNGMEGLIDDFETIATEFTENSGLDAEAICGAQKIEHFEIVSYGCLCTWAKDLGYAQALGFLKQNMAEEKEADQALNEMAKGDRNVEALQRDTEKKGAFASTISKMFSSGT